MGNAIIKNLITYLIIASIFVTGAGFGDIGFNIYWYYPFYLAFAAYGLWTFKKINVKIVTVFACIVLYSLVTYRDGLSLLIKQSINIGFAGIVSYYLLWHEKFDLEKLFGKYVTFSKVVLIIGFFQVILFYLGAGQWYIFCFPYLKLDDTTYRLQSITQEPSSIAFTFAPVVFLSLHNLFYQSQYMINKKWSFLFVVGYLLTLSSVAYIGFIMMLTLLYFKNFTFRKLKLSLFAFAGVLLLCFIAYRSISFIQIRVDDTVYALSGDFTKGNTFLEVNVSTYALISNFYVTRKSVEEYPITGNGLGTYELVYDRYIPARMREYFTLNRQDANSMGFRLATETGLVGLFAFCFFTVRFKVRSGGFSSNHEEILWILNSSIFIFILLSLLRGGNYTYHGRILFLLLYYYSYRQISQNPKPTLAQNNSLQ